MKTIVMVLAVVLLLAGCIASEEKMPNDELETKGPPANRKEASSAETEIVEQNQTTASIANSTNETIGQNLTEFDFSRTTTGDGKLIVYYFHSSACGACTALRPEIERMEQDYPEVLFLKYDITTQNGRLAYGEFAEQYNLSSSERLVPQVLVNSTIITDRFNINESLEGMIADFYS